MDFGIQEGVTRPDQFPRISPLGPIRRRQERPSSRHDPPEQVPAGAPREQGIAKKVLQGTKQAI